jgi:rhodanese-related sulfurtransferase
VRGLLLDGLFVAVVGAVLAFAANALSPRGLSLTRNFFPPDAQRSAAIDVTHTVRGAAGTNAPGAWELLAERLRAKGLTLADSNQVSKLFRDPRCEQNLVAFIDARDDEHYQAGHIPGAYQLDYYYKEKYLPPLLDLLRLAEQIVVYCNGGNCDDSELTAGLLADANIVPRDRLLVYGGGITEWATNGWPVELGERKSGRVRELKK